MSLFVDFCEMEGLAKLFDSSSDDFDPKKHEQVLRMLVGAQWMEEDSASTNLARARISLLDSVGIGKVGRSYVVLKSVGCIGFIMENAWIHAVFQTDRFLFRPLEKSVLDNLFGAAVAKNLMSESEVALIIEKFFRQGIMDPDEYFCNEMESDEYELLKRRICDKVEGTNTADQYLDDQRKKRMQQIYMDAYAKSKKDWF